WSYNRKPNEHPRGLAWGKERNLNNSREHNREREGEQLLREALRIMSYIDGLGALTPVFFFCSSPRIHSYVILRPFSRERRGSHSSTCRNRELSMFRARTPCGFETSYCLLIFLP